MSEDIRDYLFDLQGYLVLENAISEADLNEINRWIDDHWSYVNEPWAENDESQRKPRWIGNIENALSTDQERPVQATQTIDEILKVAYQLDDETFERLRLVAEWDTNPQITLDEQLDPKARWQTSGIVDNIDAKNGTITFWLRSFDELQTVPISPVMPGWLLRPEVAFRTSIPRQCVRQRHLANVSWGKFYPQDYTYLSEEELFDDLTDILSTPTEPYDS